MPQATFSIAASGDDGEVGKGNVGDTTYPPAGAVSNVDPSGVAIFPTRSFEPSDGHYSIFVGLENWDTGRIPDDAVITSAVARHRQLVSAGNTVDTDGRSLVAEYYDIGVIYAGDYVQDASSSAHAGTTLASIIANGDADMDFALVAPDANLNKAGFSGLRWHISGGRPTGPNYAGWASFDHATLAEPRLIVTFLSWIARPWSDISNAGGWTAAPLWSKLDEVTADDTDLISSPSAPSASACEIGLSPLDDPLSSANHILRFRYSKSASAGRDIAFAVQLRQGTTVIASRSVTAPTDGTWAQETYTLSAAEANAISDYTNLRLNFSATQTGAGANRSGRISWAEFQIPQITTPASRDVGGRLRLAARAFRNLASRLRLVGPGFRNVAARLKLNQRQHADAPARAGLSVATIRDGGNRLALQAVAIRRAVVSWIELEVPGILAFRNLRDAAARFVVIVAGARDAGARFKTLSGTFADGPARLGLSPPVGAAFSVIGAGVDANPLQGAVIPTPAPPPDYEGVTHTTGGVGSAVDAEPLQGSVVPEPPAPVDYEGIGHSTSEIDAATDAEPLED